MEAGPTKAEGGVMIDPSSLPEGYSMMLGDDGCSYVTVVQEGQTYAIPAAEYQMMAQEGGGTVTIQQAPTPSQEAADTIVTTPMVVEEEAGFSATENPSEVLPSPPLERPVAPPPPNSVTPTLVPVPPPNSVLVPVPPPNSVMVPVPPPTSVMVPVPKPEFLMNHSPSVAKAQAPPKKATIIPSPSPAATNKSFQPIRVDNWGIVLLNRLQTYFQKKEHTDLTIRFPAQNAQMKVHKLVMHACTDYFLNAEIEGRLVQDDGGGLTIDMTPDFTPDAVAPIVRFMYTGKLDLRASMFARLKSTAAKLQMSVLTKLMDAQLHSTPSLLPQKKASGRKNKSSLDPVKQIKKIRRIEKKFSTDEKRVRSQQALAAEQARQQQQMENTLPGKKLPIWKRRSNQPEETSASTPSKNAAVPSSSPSKLLPTPSTPTSSKPSSNPTVNSKLVLTPVSGPPPGAKLVPVPNSAVTLPPAKQTPPPPPPPPRQNQLSFDQRVTIKAEPVARAYTRNSGEMEKPRVPRQVREIQQNLNFEKLRKQTLKEAGVSSSSQSASVGGEGELSIDELSEQMAEQRRRLQEEEDYYDNDTGLDYDEVEDDFVGSDTESGSIPSTTLPVAPIKAILKASRTPEVQDPIPKKSVRFSLRPGNVPTPSASSTTSEPEAETTEEPETVVPDDDHIESPPKKNPPVPETNKISDDLDATVDEFHRAIAEEEEEEEQGTSKIEIKLQEATSSFIQTKRPRRQSGDSPPSKKKKTAETPKPGGSIDLPIQSTKRLIASTTTAPEIPMRMEVRKPSTAPPPESPKKLEVPTDQAQIVQEVLKKYPNLVKENKQVKLKIMTKDSAGNSVSQIITIRGGGEDSNLPGGVKSPLPKVCYTGRRGRPKKLKPGEHDPHAKERHQIEQRLKNPTGVDAEYATLDQVGKAHGEGSESEAALIGGEHFQQLDPSSEAEALSNVASGIAASLGLVAVDASGSHDSSMVAGGISQDATATTIIIPAEAGPLSDLENYGTTQTIMVNYEEASEGGVIALQSAPNHGSNPSLDGSSQSQGLHVLQTMPDGVSVLVPAPLTYAQAAATSSSVDSGSDVKYIGNVEDAMEKLHAEETAANCDTEKKELLASSEDGPAQSKKSVSNLAMEWSDDDD